MKIRFFQLLTYIVVLCFLASCVTTEPADSQLQNKATSANNGLFNAWNDDSIKNAAVAKLVKQADNMMQYKQWADAQGKLERTLRVSTHYAPAWSRLSWLSLRAAKHNKAIQLAHRSNSYTNSGELQQLNWTFIRDANKLLGNNDAVGAAIKKINQLKDGGFYPQGVSK